MFVVLSHSKYKTSFYFC